MAEKSFEQRVHEELGSLKMRPDAAVWSHVEAGLHKEKKRRWLLWLFFSGGLMLVSVSGYLLLNKHEPAGLVQSALTKSPPRSQHSAPVGGSLNDANDTPPTTHISHSGRGHDLTGAVVTSRSRSAGEQVVEQIPVKADPSPAQARLADARRQAPQPSGKRLQTDNDKPVDAHAAVTQTENGATGNASSLTASIAAPPVITRATNSAMLPDSASAGRGGADSTGTPAPARPLSKADSAISTAAVVKKAQRSKWRLAISGGIGRSGVRTHLLSIPSFLEKSYDPSTSYSSAPSTGVGNGNAGNNVYTTPPAVTDATGFLWELRADKSVSKSISVGITAGYTLYRTNTTVGRRIDSTRVFSYQNTFNTNGYYFLNNDSAVYSNHYHFLNLGADMYTSFSLFKKLPMRWRLGFGIQYLVASNGLHYDEVYHRSFQNNDLFNRLQTYMLTGIDIGIGKDPYLYIGPHFSWQLGQLAKNATGPNHLMMGSLQASFILQKNNRKKK